MGVDCWFVARPRVPGEGCVTSCVVLTGTLFQNRTCLSQSDNRYSCRMWRNLKTGKKANAAKVEWHAPAPWNHAPASALGALHIASSQRFCAVLKLGHTVTFPYASERPHLHGTGRFCRRWNHTGTVIKFHPSAQAQARFADLIEGERETRLTAEEIAELNHFLELGHIHRMAKAKARLILANRS